MRCVASFKIGHHVQEKGIFPIHRLMGNNYVLLNAVTYIRDSEWSIQNHGSCRIFIEFLSFVLFVVIMISKIKCLAHLRI